MFGYLFKFFSVYLIECAALWGLYDVSHAYLERNYASFREINPSHKKWYVVSNLIKGGVLGLMLPLFYKILSGDLFGGVWDTDYVSHLGCVYASLDMVSVFRVPKLARNTLYHHLAVNGLFLYVLGNGADNGSFSRLIAIYAVFSALAFSVNMYLAIRVLSKDTRLLKAMSSFCFVNYVACCAANWSYQLYHLIWTPHFFQAYGIVPVLAFCGMIAVVMWDDIILIRYLKQVSYFQNWLEGRKWLADFSK